jgi:hypothetical protein
VAFYGLLETNSGPSSVVHGLNPKMIGTSSLTVRMERSHNLEKSVALGVRTVQDVLHKEAVTSGAAKIRISSLSGSDCEMAKHEEGERVRRWIIAHSYLDLANSRLTNLPVTILPPGGDEPGAFIAANSAVQPTASVSN